MELLIGEAARSLSAVLSPFRARGVAGPLDPNSGSAPPAELGIPVWWARKVIKE
jgi:hypothetical protein